MRLMRSQIDLGEHHALAFRAHAEHLAPRIDDHGVAVGAPAAGVRAALRRRDHVGLVLDRARAQQRLPVRAPVGTVKAEGTNITSNSPSPR